MAFDVSIYRHFPLATLQAWLTAQVSGSTDGNGLIIEYTINGVMSVRREGSMTREEFLSAVNWALERLDPANYPPLVDRTRIAFSTPYSTVTDATA